MEQPGAHEDQASESPRQLKVTISWCSDDDIMLGSHDVSDVLELPSVPARKTKVQVEEAQTIPKTVNVTSLPESYQWHHHLLTVVHEKYGSEAVERLINNMSQATWFSQYSNLVERCICCLLPMGNGSYTQKIGLRVQEHLIK